MRGVAVGAWPGRISRGALSSVEIGVALTAELFQRVGRKQFGVDRIVRSMAGEADSGLERTVQPLVLDRGQGWVQAAVALKTKHIHPVAQHGH